ncbi:MAG: sensor histidine kinase [Acidimicrobiales bacterium]
MAKKPSAGACLLALFVALVQVLGTLGAADNQSGRRPIDAAAVAALLAGPLALAVRERWPRSAAVVSATAMIGYVAAGYPFGPIVVSFAVGLFFVVQTADRKATFALAGGAFVGFAAAVRVANRQSPPLFTHLALVAGWLLVVLAVSEVLRVRREQAATRAQTVRDEQQRRADELRIHIAQDVHDVLAHNLSLISVQAGVALHLLEDHPEQARPALSAIKMASREALDELRHALQALRSGEAAPRGPTPGLGELEHLVAGVRRLGLAVSVTGTDPPPHVPATVGHAVYRVVQEALTNITRHAGAKTAVVHISAQDTLIVEVSDDGRGGPIVEGHGITGMRQRVGALGGSVAVGAAPDGGTRVWASIPVRMP